MRRIAAIYAPIVRNTAISFEYEPPTAGAVRVASRPRCDSIWLVCDGGGVIEGYACRPAPGARRHQWSVTLRSTFMRLVAMRHRPGVVRCSRSCGHRAFNVYAGITLPNAASVGSMSDGAHSVGIYRSVG
jgi:phosphinothricin acetyltransferase